MLLMDCDGVLTDGRLYYSENGEELKVFHVHDGQGLVSWHRAGFSSGIITGRESKSLELRASELGVRFLRQSSTDKSKDFEDIIGIARVLPEEVAFIGDDVPDILLFKKVGLAIAVANAVEEIYSEANYITKRDGGFGAVREVINLILFSKKA